MLTKVAKWGNSLAIRIPGELVKESGLKEGGTVEMEVNKRTLIIKPKKGLEELLAGITEENLHSEQDIGESVGKEEW